MVKDMALSHAVVYKSGDSPHVLAAPVTHSHAVHHISDDRPGMLGVLSATYMHAALTC